MSKKVLFLVCILLEDVLASTNTRHVNIQDYPYHVSRQDVSFMFNMCFKVTLYQVPQKRVIPEVVVSIERNRNHACSGALVHESWVITAASCVFGADLSTVSVRVRTGTLAYSGDELEPSGIVMHEDFDKYVLLNDIALIKLKVPVQFGEKLLPIGLPDENDSDRDDETICYVTGWKRNLDGPGETQLTATAVPIVNQDTCISKIPSYEPVFQKMLCAGNMTLGVETCQGDPGAPLMEGQTLIGILSYGLGCKTMIHPGVYTRVSSYSAWISANSGIRYT